MSKGTTNQQQLILNVIAKYSKFFEEYIEGRFVKDTATMLKGGSRINYIFFDIYTPEISKMDPFDALSDEDIKTAIRNASSLGPNLFLPEVAFELLCKQQISRLEQPSLQCVQMVYEELRKIVFEIDIPELVRFTALRRQMNEVMLNLLNKCLKPTNKMISNLVLVQNSYINTYHPDFYGGGSSIQHVLMSGVPINQNTQNHK